MSETLPAELQDANPRHRHLYRVLADAEGWTGTATLAEETGYARETVQEACGRLGALGVVEERRDHEDLRRNLYRLPD